MRLQTSIHLPKNPCPKSVMLVQPTWIWNRWSCNSMGKPPASTGKKLRIRIQTSQLFHPMFFTAPDREESHHSLGPKDPTPEHQPGAKINLKSIFTKPSVYAFLTPTRIKAIFSAWAIPFCKALADWQYMFVLHEEKLLSLQSLSHPGVSVAFHSITPQAPSGSGNHWKRWHRCERALRFQFWVPSAVSFKTRLVISQAHQRGHHLELQDSNAGLTRLLN